MLFPHPFSVAADLARDVESSGSQLGGQEPQTVVVSEGQLQEELCHRVHLGTSLQQTRHSHVHNTKPHVHKSHKQLVGFRLVLNFHSKQAHGIVLHIAYSVFKVEV